ncbi:MAG: CFI-box-CTERM domain-containing protein [bacterium]
MRIVRLFVVLALVSLVGPPASGQSFTVNWYGQDTTNALTAEDFVEWVNMARCLCSAYDESSPDAVLTMKVSDPGPGYTTDEVFFYLGDDCDNDSVTISEQCRELAVINHSDFNQEQSISIPAHWIVSPQDGICTEQNGGTSTVYVIMRDPNETATTSWQISYDTAPPGTPESLSTQAGENAVTVSWDPPTTNEENIEFYDVLCALDGAPLASPTADADWTSTQEVCGQELTPSDIPNADAGVDAQVPDAQVTDDASVGDGGVANDASTVTPDADVQSDAAPPDASTNVTDCTNVTSGLTAGSVPSPCFVCGSVTASTTEVRIEGLENDAVYSFAVVSVDDNGNVSVVSEVVSATPVLTTDFAEQYAGAGGAEDGGFCFVATAVYGSYDHPDVRQLRTYRDEVLARTAAGRRFIGWYYDSGPALVQLTQQVPKLGPLARIGVQGLVWISRQVTPGAPGADGGHAGTALPVGLLLLGMVLGLSRLSARREEADEDDPHGEVRK